MLELNRQTQPAAHRHLITSLAHSEAEVLEAQRLRYKVFSEEMGANLPSASEGIDRDMFDKYCEHLLVRESDANKVGQEIPSCCRKHLYTSKIGYGFIFKTRKELPKQLILIFPGTSRSNNMR
ncbi:MAG: GNAT family N-acetyltransferase [Gallionella sp.]|nr:GNAT family N-acetyltransferase [Gallionella sp.]